MCADCDWKGFAAEARDLIDETESIPERGRDFAESVRGKLYEMKEWAEENSHVTEKMTTALENMQGGVQKWLRGR